MPYEKDVLERQYWWCPKWYWPFAVCSGIRTQHKWCYDFDWVHGTGYTFVIHYEGCERGRLFTWTETKPGIILGSFTEGPGERCYNSSRGGDEGRCDSSNTGLQASGLSASDPYVSDIDYDVAALSSEAVETGTFNFAGENETLCQKGLWPWTRTLHGQVITASVVTRFAQIEWFVGGILVSGSSGTVSPSVSSTWPFPLPKGRSENRVVHIKYSIVTDPNKSTLKLFNDPNDGSYSFSLAINAFDNGIEVRSYYTSANFKGETCDFAPEKVKDLAQCWKHFADVSRDKAKSKVPKPGEPVIGVSDGIWQYVREEHREVVDSILQVIANTFQDDPQLFTQAVEQLDRELGPAAASTFISIGSSASGHAENITGQVSPLGRMAPLAGALVFLGIGFLVGRLRGASSSSPRNRS